MTTSTARSSEQETLPMFVLPSKLDSALKAASINYTLVSTSPKPEYCNCEQIAPPALDTVVVLIILQDSLGQEQFLMPQNHLIDVRQLCEQNGRNLQALAPAAWASARKNQGLPLNSNYLAAVPQTQALTTQAAEVLRSKSVLYLASGFTRIYLKIEGKKVERFFENTRFISQFSVPVDKLWQSIRQCGDTKSQLTSAVENFTTLRIKQRLDKTLEIPPLPETAQKIINLRVNSDASINDLSKIVEIDPSLAAQVVSWASSPYYNAPGGISSVHDAVVRVLGFDLVINLALGLSMGKTLKLPTDGPRGAINYWKQAVFTAALVEALVSRMDRNERPSIGLAYLTGLLNNFGALILSYVFPPHYSLIGRFIEANPHQVHSVIEQHVLGISREQIAAWVMRLWDMPEEVVIALQWQQIPEYKGKHDSYAKLLFVANQLLRRMHHQGSPIGNPVQPLTPSLLATLGLTVPAADEALAYVMARRKELAKMADSFG